MAYGRLCVLRDLNEGWNQQNHQWITPNKSPFPRVILSPEQDPFRDSHEQVLYKSGIGRCRVLSDHRSDACGHDLPKPELMLDAASFG